FTPDRSIALKFPTTNKGTTESRLRSVHSLWETYARPICSCLTNWPSPLQKSVESPATASPECAKLIFISASASRCFHLPIVSSTLFPCDKFAASVAIGYHATLPIPRTAVNDGPISSQSVCFATSEGTPIRVSLVVS